MPSGSQAGTLAATGERLIPDRQHGELVHAEHLARYRFAAQLAGGRRVLDVACGEGYGSALLAQTAASVTGADIDSETVAHARARHGIEAEVADIGSLPFADGSFDLIVCFETIEHVKAPERALAELERVRAPGGLVVISTPNVAQSLVENKFHVHEFGFDEFLAVLAVAFPVQQIHHQHNWLTSAVLDADAMRESSGHAPVGLGATKVLGVEPGGELYLVAICGDEIPELHSTSVLAGVDESHALAKRLVDSEATAREWHDAFLSSERNARAMTHTVSWRVTRPFRLLARLVRRVR